MSQSVIDWTKLPYQILEEVMLMIGQSCPEDLDRCRQVCKVWNVMIMRKLWERPTRKWGAIIGTRIEQSWSNEHFPSYKKLTYALELGKYRE